ncbi:MAG: SPOR domain-containing protein [Tatlockia sp.]|jgi:DedD protein
MKLVLDEKVKHRLIGLAVILSIAAIFAPAIMKKSSQRLDGNVNVSVELPPKPIQPDVAMTEKKALFSQVKLARVELPEVSKEEDFPRVAKAEPLSQQTQVLTSELEKEPQLLSGKSTPPVTVVHRIARGIPFPNAPKAPVVAKNARIVKKERVITKPAIIRSTVARAGYGIQLAVFSKQENAMSLISRLKSKGYPASYNRVVTTEGMRYKVIVGKVAKKEQAQVLQRQLASAMQIRGMIVPKGQG